MEYPWVAVSGFGAHIKSTQKHLIIQKKDGVEQYSLEKISHILIVGGHVINSATITQLVKRGIYVTFFSTDGTPIGMIRPYSEMSGDEIFNHPPTIPRHRYAIAIAQASINARLLTIQNIQESRNVHLFYEGELEFLKKSQNELEYLIKLDEIRRLFKLTTDMYYEIMSRDIPSCFGFKRRTSRPHIDPINAMLSFGYAMLFGNCSVAVVGAHLNPDQGLMSEGKGSLVNDLMEPLKVGMVDLTVFNMARERLTPSDFELTQDRCILSDNVIKLMMKSFYTTIITNTVNQQVYNFFNAQKTNQEFKILY